MKRNKMGKSIFLILLCFCLAAEAQPGDGETHIREHYIKMERYIPMRDGARLYTSIKVPGTQIAGLPFSIPVK